ncbi:hypothetical protein R1sor_015234 [Riccia sorocarpa]|uniref:Uncharacterized protein n=1 Tax=Riccia sorocarpa TaxID=122646 RepID=A0ABD3HFI5_9MARC
MMAGEARRDGREEEARPRLGKKLQAGGVHKHMSRLQSEKQRRRQEEHDEMGGRRRHDHDRRKMNVMNVKRDTEKEGVGMRVAFRKQGSGRQEAASGWCAQATSCLQSEKRRRRQEEHDVMGRRRRHEHDQKKMNAMNVMLATGLRKSYSHWQNMTLTLREITINSAR